MSRIRADKFVDRAATGAPELTQGVNFGASGVGGTITATGQAEFAGVCTASSFVGDLTGGVTGNATGLSGTPDISVKGVNSTGIVTAVMFSGNITGTAGTFSGNVSVGGVLSYEDVQNVDSVGIVTARSGVRIVGGGVTAAGIATFHDGADIEGFKVEDGQTAATPNGEFNFYLADGHIFRYTGTAGGDYYPNFKHSASINLNDRMDANDVVSATLIVNSATASYHIANTIHIDGNATGENSYTIDTDWVGGSAPDAGNGSGHDVYSFTIIKTADKTFTIIANSVAAA